VVVEMDEDPFILFLIIGFYLLLLLERLWRWGLDDCGRTN
jgi:hypothetical protein